MVLRRVKDLVRQKFNVSIAEVAENDVWQRAVLGIALVGNERRFVEGALDEVLAFMRAKAEVTSEERELQTFSDSEPLIGADFRHWQGLGARGRCRNGRSESRARCAPWWAR